MMQVIFEGFIKQLSMKISSKFKVRSMVGQNVIVQQGKYGGDMTRIISLNDTALFLWNALKDKEFSVNDVRDAILGEYEIDRETAEKDAAAWCEKLRECRLIEDTENQGICQ